MSLLTFITQTLAYDDLPRNSNPVLTGINRRVSVNNIPVDNPQTLRYDLAPGASWTVFNGSRSLLVDGTTAFSLTLSPINSTTYRLLNTGGTAPGFRTARSIPIANVALTLSVGANLAMTVTAATGTPFTAAQAGDTLFIPGTSTGDALSPFNSLNEGLWTVLTPGTASIVVARSANNVFSGITEVVTPVSNTQFQIFSSDNVQVGDTVGLSLGFATSALHAYDITAVTPSWIEFNSGLPLGTQTGIIPTAAGIAVYTSAKRWVQIETDQEILFQINGDTGLFNKVTPIVPGDPDLKGTSHLWSTIWELILINHSSSVAHLILCTVE